MLCKSPTSCPGYQRFLEFLKLIGFAEVQNKIFPFSTHQNTTPKRDTNWICVRFAGWKAGILRFCWLLATLQKVRRLQLLPDRYTLHTMWKPVQRRSRPTVFFWSYHEIPSSTCVLVFVQLEPKPGFSDWSLHKGSGVRFKVHAADVGCYLGMKRA